MMDGSVKGALGVIWQLCGEVDGWCCHAPNSGSWHSNRQSAASAPASTFCSTAVLSFVGTESLKGLGIFSSILSMIYHPFKCLKSLICLA